MYVSVARENTQFRILNMVFLGIGIVVDLIVFWLIIPANLFSNAIVGVFLFPIAGTTLCFVAVKQIYLLARGNPKVAR